MSNQKTPKDTRADKLAFWAKAKGKERSERSKRFNDAYERGMDTRAFIAQESSEDCSQSEKELNFD